MSLKDLNKKLFVYLALIILVIIGIFVGISMINGSKPKKVSYPKLENILTKAAKQYYEEHSDLLPLETEVVVEHTTLETEEFMKPLESQIKEEGVACTGKVTVRKTEGGYLYIPSLDCGKSYHTRNIKEVITDSANLVKTGNGLYQVGSEEKKEYVYRGEIVDNYMMYADKIWRIVKINTNGDLVLLQEQDTTGTVWDDRYNSDRGYNSGINNYEKSRARETVQAMYANPDFLPQTHLLWLVPQTICLDEKKSNGSNKTCKKTLTDMIGYLDAFDYKAASLDGNCKNLMDKSCQNYNYLALYDKSWWTVTAEEKNKATVYSIDRVIESSSLVGYKRVHAVLHITGDALYDKGDGSFNAPYEIK